MSGILERIEAKLDQLLAGTAHAAAAAPQAAPVAPQVIPATPAPATALDPLGGAPAATGAAPATGYPPATQEMIVALVTPLVNDPNTKALLQAEMHAMGIAALPEAQPHQYPELYARFQGVQSRVAQAQAQVQQPAATPASIT